jgi:hypothetical protein
MVNQKFASIEFYYCFIKEKQKGLELTFNNIIMLALFSKIAKNK